MRIRGLHLRGVLLPLSVAIAAVAALALYDLIWIPAQQRYLNERNLRFLRTMSAQIKAKVDNFDQSIDHAIESQKVADLARANPVVEYQEFQDYVKAFAPDLEILGNDHHSAGADLVRRMPGDPPRVTIQRDEGTNYLYLGYKHYLSRSKFVVVVARSNIEEVASAFLSVGTDFDALLLVERTGRVIVAQSPSGLELARVDSLAETARPRPSSATADTTSYFETLRTSSTIVDVTLGDEAYKLYVQPIQLSLNSLPVQPAEPAAGTRKSDDRASEYTVEPEVWALCGLVRADHFRGASAVISYTYVLWFAAALASLIIAIPLLKLHVLAPRERLRGVDGVWVAVTMFLATALLTWAVVDAHYFGSVFRRVTDDQLRDVAEQLRGHLTDEMEQIWLQLDHLPSLFEELGYPTSAGKARDLPFNGAPLPRARAARETGTIVFSDDHGTCVPSWTCRDSLLARLSPGTIAGMEYPFFSIATWEDLDGWQRVKWTTSPVVTPFINLEDTRSARYRDLKAAWRLGARGTASGPVVTNGIEVAQSPNTGDILTVFWRGLEASPGRDTGTPGRPDTDADRESHQTVLISQSLSVTAPLAISRPVLPPNVQFAVLDDDGLVMFHAEPARSLKENFFEECEGNAALRAAVKGRLTRTINVYYLGRRHRLHVMPFATGRWSGRRPWSLVVFQDTIVPETMNLETLTLTVAMFAIYAAALAAVWGLAYLFWTDYPVKWFWPDQSRRGAYRGVWSINALLAAVFVAWGSQLSPTQLLVGTSALVVVSFVVTFILVARGKQTPAGAAWEREFLLARVSLLIVVAAVPAVACFRAAYEFETTLLIKSGQLSLARQLQAREDRTRREAERFKLCGRLEPFCGRAAGLTATGGPWDIYLTPFFGTCRVGLDAACARVVADPTPLDHGRLDTFLAIIHRPYNNVGVELQTAIGDRVTEWYWSRTDARTLVFARAQAPPKMGAKAFAASDLTATRTVPNIWYWSSLIGLTLGLYLMMRSVAHRLFALDLRVRPGFEPGAGSIGLAANVLLLGPPGSGKTALLIKAGFPVFDVRKIRAAVPVFAAVSRGRSMQSTGTLPDAPGQPPGAPADWVDSFDYSALPDPIGIDHFEHRLDEPEVRDQMLRFLEELVYRYQRHVWIASVRDPLSDLQDRAGPETDASGPEGPELDRWTRLFASFRTEYVRVEEVGSFVETVTALAKGASPTLVGVMTAECSPTPQLRALGEHLAAQCRGKTALLPEDVMFAIGEAADSYYRAVWRACSRNEQLALRQLAEEGVVNPRNQRVLVPLMRNGLIQRQTTFRLMNETFRRFIVGAVSPDTIAEWEREGVPVSWGSIKATLLTVALGLGGMLVLTQEQLLDAWIGYVPTLAAAVSTVIPSAIRLFGSVQHRTPAETGGAG
jgi:hypothetical protein